MGFLFINAVELQKIDKFKDDCVYYCNFIEHCGSGNSDEYIETYQLLEYLEKFYYPNQRLF